MLKVLVWYQVQGSDSYQSRVDEPPFNAVDSDGHSDDLVGGPRPTSQAIRLGQPNDQSSFESRSGKKAERNWPSMAAYQTPHKLTRTDPSSLRLHGPSLSLLHASRTYQVEGR